MVVNRGGSDVGGGEDDDDDGISAEIDSDPIEETVAAA